MGLSIFLFTLLLLNSGLCPLFSSTLPHRALTHSYNSTLHFNSDVTYSLPTRLTSLHSLHWVAYNMYTVVHVTSSEDDAVQLVPTCWVNFDLNFCRWPSGPKDQKNVSALVKKLKPVDLACPIHYKRNLKTAGKLYLMIIGNL